jgi:hypothetical protein
MNDLARFSKVLVVGVYWAVFVLKIAAEQLLVVHMESSFSTSISTVPSLQPSQVLLGRDHPFSMSMLKVVNRGVSN